MVAGKEKEILFAWSWKQISEKYEFIRFFFMSSFIQQTIGTQPVANESAYCIGRMGKTAMKKKIRALSSSA